MQCFLCMTYVVFFCNALPVEERDLTNQHERRSLFRDVIESLRIRSQLPDDLNQNDENNLAHNYERYGYDNEPPQLPSDAEFIPRRNDRIERIEMPNLKYRYPKSLFDKNETKNLDNTEQSKEEIILYVSTTKEQRLTTAKPKKPQKRPYAPITNVKVQYKDEEEISEEPEAETPDDTSVIPLNNNMAGQSQIGNRESQMVVKPTVIINFRGSVSHRDSDIRLSGRKTDENSTRAEVPPNIFNIKQEVNLERTFSGMGSRGGPKHTDITEPVKVEGKVLSKAEESDMMMCETATSASWSPEKKVRDARRIDNVFQILFAV